MHLGADGTRSTWDTPLVTIIAGAILLGIVFVLFGMGRRENDVVSSIVFVVAFILTVGVELLRRHILSTAPQVVTRKCLNCGYKWQ